MTRKKPVAMEIVDDKAVPVEPVSPALEAAADTPQPPEPEELIEAQAVTVTVRVAPLRVERIEQARALLELAKDEPGAPVELAADGIQAFKSTDGRTMLVVVRDGNLYSQEK